MTLIDYIDKINTRFKSGITTEHSFRGDLQNLLESWLPDILVTNEPTHIKCGAPDYILTRKGIPVGYIEAKDLGADLNSKSYTEQFNRYREALNNLIITNYIDFQVFKDGNLVATYTIGEIKGNNVISNQSQFEPFQALVTDFVLTVGQTIKSSQKLAEMMANKAKMLAQIIEAALLSDKENSEDSSLKDQMTAFQQILIHDIKAKGFSDIYAQTIAYGMFAARYHDSTLDTFSRQEAAELIPKSNPFLRRLFQYIAGYDLDDRIKWIVDDLADIFRATNVAALLKDFGKSTQQHDPIIHFYETFLSEYDPKLRKSRGVWYTPEPVVKFIVRAVDDILKTDFSLGDGLAETTKTTIKVDVQGKKIEQEVHKVQILDPATGTGTFLAEVIKHIYNDLFIGQQGIWSHYVENDLIPRLNGFELLMASYAMAHLKLDMLLTETGYKPSKEQRFRVYLTNSLEEYHPDTGTLFANWLSTEANEANYIKRDTPVMCVIGNPPYSAQSSNKGKWIEKLLETYKKEPYGGKLQEKNSKWLNDDYVKFLRYGQYYIEKNGEGILAYISNNSFLDNPTFRGMRYNLLQTFDKIYIINLHGSSNKKEITPNGSKDENVFDIKQGVSINIFVKRGKKKKNELAEILYFDLFGLREEKYQFLQENHLNTICFENILPKSNYYFFIKKNFTNENNYNSGFLLSELFIDYSTGYYTSCDDLVIANSSSELEKQVIDHLKNSYLFDKTLVHKTTYRPFDNKYIYYDISLITRSRNKFVLRFLEKENVILIIGKSTSAKEVNHFFLSNIFSELKCGEYSRGSYMFPLYLYNDNNGQQSIEQNVERNHNLKKEIITNISEKLGLPFTDTKEINEGSFSPIDILDYIYSVLYSPTYRDKYIELLKIDFPRVPYPRDIATFWQMAKLGGELRQLHLLESTAINKLITQYPIDGSNTIVKVIFIDGNVWINETQYFANVPKVAWEFYIGGYQPAQKWLKDRKNRILGFNDILHYQKIIVALTETDRLMKEIDLVKFLD